MGRRRAQPCYGGSQAESRRRGGQSARGRGHGVGHRGGRSRRHGESLLGLGGGWGGVALGASSREALLPSVVDTRTNWILSFMHTPKRKSMVEDPFIYFFTTVALNEEIEGTRIAGFHGKFVGVFEGYVRGWWAG